MGPVNVMLWLGGIALIAIGYSRARGPWSRYQALKAQDENVARYEAWRGGARDDGKTGASVAMAILRRQPGRLIADRRRSRPSRWPARRRALLSRLPGPVVDGAVAGWTVSRQPPDRGRRRSSAHSIAVQRSITTLRPASCAIRAASQFTTPSWSHRQRAPAATASRACGTHSSERRKTSTMSNGPVPSTASLSEAKAVTPMTARSFGLTGTQSKPWLEQVAEDAERRSPRVRRGADHGDAVRGAQDGLDPEVVEDRDRRATLLQVEDRGGAIALVAGQVAASRSYGWPSAAGGMLRPTTPARITMVTR